MNEKKQSKQPAANEFKKIASRTMNEKAQLSLEWILTLLFILMIIFSIPGGAGEKNSFEKELISLKSQDLLVVWAGERQDSIDEMKKDAEFLFGKKKTEIELNGENESGKKRETEKQKTSEEIDYYDEKFNKIHIRLTLFG